MNFKLLILCHQTGFNFKEVKSYVPLIKKLALLLYLHSCFTLYKKILKSTNNLLPAIPNLFRYTVDSNAFLTNFQCRLPRTSYWSCYAKDDRLGAIEVVQQHLLPVIPDLFRYTVDSKSFLAHVYCIMQIIKNTNLPPATLNRWCT